MLVGVLPEDIAEEGAAGGDDHLVSFDLIVITGQSYVEKVFLVPELPKGPTDVGLEVVPLQAEFLRAHGLSLVSSLWFVILFNVQCSVVRGQSRGNFSNGLKLFTDLLSVCLCSIWR